MGLERLELRRIHLDLCLVYKIIRGLIEIDFDRFFEFKRSATRGHNYTLAVKRSSKDCRKFFFSNRVVNWWNCLSNETVNSHNISLLRTNLSKENFNRFIKGGGD